MPTRTLARDALPAPLQDQSSTRSVFYRDLLHVIDHYWAWSFVRNLEQTGRRHLLRPQSASPTDPQGRGETEAVLLAPRQSEIVRADEASPIDPRTDVAGEC